MKNNNHENDQTADLVYLFNDLLRRVDADGLGASVFYDGIIKSTPNYYFALGSDDEKNIDIASLRSLIMEYVEKRISNTCEGIFLDKKIDLQLDWGFSSNGKQVSINDFLLSIPEVIRFYSGSSKRDNMEMGCFFLANFLLFLYLLEQPKSVIWIFGSNYSFSDYCMSFGRSINKEQHMIDIVLMNLKLFGVLEDLNGGMCGV